MSGRKRKRENNEPGVKKRRKPRAPTPLQRFRAQTILKRKELKAQRRECDRKLREIERDLGVLKRR